MLDARLARDIEAALALALPAARPLALEITESSLLADQGRVAPVLEHIRGLGVPVAIDDFGTGYSSLAYLAELPVDTLKIDRAFIAKMTAEPRYRRLVSTIIQLAHNLQLSVVAEGIETVEQAELLRALNCDEGQGFLYRVPLPGASFAALLREQTLGRPLRPAPVAL